jgi:hypothetical protein
MFRSVKYLATYARSARRNACVGFNEKCPSFLSFYLARNEKDSVRLYNIGFDENPFIRWFSSFCGPTDRHGGADGSILQLFLTNALKMNISVRI